MLVDKKSFDILIRRQAQMHFIVTIWKDCRHIYRGVIYEWSVATRSKVWACGLSPAEIVGSNPTGGIDVCFECCVLSGRGLCDELITCQEESYRLWCVVLCDLETS